jgi:hypothetical protein
LPATSTWKEEDWSNELSDFYFSRAWGFQPIIYGKNFLLFLNSPQKKQKTQSKQEKI